ncbi:MAG: transcriptional regulator [Candidatus Hermodarchaeota archaeon]
MKENDTPQNTDKHELIPPIDTVFGSPIRLAIMLILLGSKKVGFTELQKLLKITPGKLGHHINKLETKNYVHITKTFLLMRPHTVIKLTADGEASFRDYIRKLRTILNKIE